MEHLVRYRLSLSAEFEKWHDSWEFQPYSTVARLNQVASYPTHSAVIRMEQTNAQAYNSLYDLNCKQALSKMHPEPSKVDVIDY